MLSPITIRAALAGPRSARAPAINVLAIGTLIGAFALVSSPAQAEEQETTVSTAQELTAALSSADPGETIILADGEYEGDFASARSGTAADPITLTGSRQARLTTGSISSGYGLHLTGSNWNLTGFSVSTASKGIVLDDSDNTVIDGVDVGSIGLEGVHVRTSSTDVSVRNSVIHDTGLVKPSFGEGIYVGSANSNWDKIMGSSDTPDASDNVTVDMNTISNTSAEGIDIKEGTTGGHITGNVFDNAGYSGKNYADSWVDVKGNGYTFADNSGNSTRLDAFQVHSALPGWGQDNVFADNTVGTGVTGYEVKISSAATGNTVQCDTSGADQGLTNVTCG